MARDDGMSIGEFNWSLVRYIVGMRYGPIGSRYRHRLNYRIMNLIVSFFVSYVLVRRGCRIDV